MGNLRAYLALALLSLAACGDDGGNATPDAAVDASPDAKIWSDAPPPMFDFTCAGNTAPTAAATIDIAGTVQNVSGSFTSPTVAAAGDVAVSVCQGTCAGNDELASTTSASDGSYSFDDLPTSNGEGLDVYLRGTRTGDRTSFVYPASPFTSSPPMVPIPTFSATFFPPLIQSATNGMLIVALTDCADMPITDSANVELSIKQNNVEVTGTTVVDAAQFDPNLAGGFLVFNVPPGEVTTVGATWNGMALRAHDVRIVATTTTVTLLRPGF
jgi:predicted small lipoprotein YifL